MKRSLLSDLAPNRPSCRGPRRWRATSAANWFGSSTRTLRFPGVILLTLLGSAPLSLRAQSAPAAESPNRFNASFRMAFNLGVKFKFSGGFPNQTDPGLDNLSGRDNRRYDDGYNLVDDNNNTYYKGDLPPYEPLTSNWGYDRGSQVVDSRYVVMHSASSPAASSSA